MLTTAFAGAGGGQVARPFEQRLARQLAAKFLAEARVWLHRHHTFDAWRPEEQGGV